jgi:SAM-dependent methyltransferase
MCPSDRAATQVHFDQYADSYDAALNQGLAATGEEKDYFARARIQWLARRLSQLGEQARRIMDYGCGDGSSSEFLVSLIRAESLLGVDTSEKSVKVATQNHGGKNCSFLAIGQYSPEPDQDLVYCNGVFHHIPLVERAAALDYVRRALRPGGLFALWENNPWNPGTRYVMSRIPFDRDAITLTPPEARAFVRRGGFQVLQTDSLFFFPKQLKRLRWMEPYLAALPLGGQYLVLCRKS